MGNAKLCFAKSFVTDAERRAYDLKSINLPPGFTDFHSQELKLWHLTQAHGWNVGEPRAELSMRTFRAKIASQSQLGQTPLLPVDLHFCCPHQEFNPHSDLQQEKKLKTKVKNCWGPSLKHKVHAPSFMGSPHRMCWPSTMGQVPGMPQQTHQSPGSYGADILHGRQRREIRMGSCEKKYKTGALVRVWFEHPLGACVKCNPLWEWKLSLRKLGLVSSLDIGSEQPSGRPWVKPSDVVKKEIRETQTYVHFLSLDISLPASKSPTGLTFSWCRIFLNTPFVTVCPLCSTVGPLLYYYFTEAWRKRRDNLASSALNFSF